jgi:hypothetical protein
MSFTDVTTRQSDSRCANANAGTYNHECGKPATWTARGEGKATQNFCDQCKDEGHEAVGFTSWKAYAPWSYYWLDGELIECSHDTSTADSL